MGLGAMLVYVKIPTPLPISSVTLEKNYLIPHLESINNNSLLLSLLSGFNKKMYVIMPNGIAGS